jgi:hypothetical protein
MPELVSLRGDAVAAFAQAARWRPLEPYGLVILETTRPANTSRRWENIAFQILQSADAAGVTNAMDNRVCC